MGLGVAILFGEAPIGGQDRRACHGISDAVRIGLRPESS